MLRTRSLKEEEVERLIESAPDHEWQTLILFAYYLGTRLSDYVRLTWENVHLEKGVIVYKQQKTSKTVIIPMHDHIN